MLAMAGMAQAQAILYGAAHTGGPGGASTLYTIDPATGTLTAVGPIGFNACSGMDVHPATGILYATCFRPVDGTHVLITIDPATGAGTEVGPTGVEGLGFGNTVSDISFRNSDHTVYAYLEPGNGVGTIDISAGAATALGPSSSGGCCGNGIAFSPADTLFHATNDILETLEQTTGVATFVTVLSLPVCGTGALPRINAMDFQPGTGILFGSLNDGLAGGVGPICLVTIDTATGDVALIGLTVAGLDALAWSSAPAECPEDPDAVLTRAVDPEGDDPALIGGIPTSKTLQDAVDAAHDGEVIGFYGRSTENVIIDGAKSLTITQCTVAQIIAAAAAPVVDITSTTKITIISLDAVGGTIGWRVGTDGHDLKSVRATGTSQFGILVVGNYNSISYNSVRSSAVGIGVDGDFNDLRGGTVEDNTGDGVQVRRSANNNTFRTASVLSNRGNGIFVAGSSNTIRDNGRVNGNTLNGLRVTGSNNSLRSNRAEENTQDGFNISGNTNTLQDNKANKNRGDGFEISGAGNILKGNASNQGASGGSNENSGAEYRLINAAINQGGNKADNIGVPKTTAPTKCPTFPAAGICE